MKKNWLIASFKVNEIKRVEINLQNQKFKYYLPKIITKKTNSKLKEELLFPGYIFVNTNFENYSALKYTKGIKNIIKFGNNIAFISDEEIKSIQIAEDLSKLNPIFPQIKVGQDAFISKGSLKGNMVKICSLPSKERVTVLLAFLGTMRRVNIPVKDLNF